MLDHKGILMIATGFPIYGRLAYNNALTIRSMSPDMPIAIVCDEVAMSHLSDAQRAIFTQEIPAPATGFGLKLHVDLLSPFERTLFLDADMAWMPKHGPDTLFENLEGVEFESITEGYYDAATGDNSNVNGAYFFWAGIEEIVSRYKIKGKIYQWRSEVMYFTKTKKVKALFERARKIYANPKLKTAKLFGQQIPDELALNIAAALTGIEPHEYKWTPAYWPALNGHKVPTLEEMYNQYYLFSAGGHHTSDAAKRLYNRLVNVASQKMGNAPVFPLTDKYTSITDRAKI